MKLGGNLQKLVALLIQILPFIRFKEVITLNQEPNLQKLLRVLKDGNWHSSDELASKVSWRFGHTVFDARKKGYSIETRMISHNQYEYRMP